MEADQEELMNFYPETEEKFNQHIAAIRSSDEWADNLEIEILQRLLNRPIIILRLDANPTIPDNLSELRGKPIFVYYNGHTHYDAFILQEGFEARAILNNIMTTIEQGHTILYNVSETNYSLNSSWRPIMYSNTNTARPGIQLTDYLKNRIEEEIKIIHKKVDAMEMDIARQGVLYFEQRSLIAEKMALNNAKLQTVTSYLREPSQFSPVILNESYQLELKKAVHHCVTLYSDTIEEQKSIVRDGEIIRLQTPEAKQAEVERYKLLLTAKLPEFQNFHFDMESDLASLELSLQNECHALETQSDDLISQWETKLMELQENKSSLQRELKQKKDFLVEQQKLLEDYQPAPIEQFCIIGDLIALENALKPYKNNENKVNYLKEHAPNALHFACWNHEVEIVKYLLALGVSSQTPDTIPISVAHTTHYYPLHYVAMIMFVEGVTTQECLDALRDHGAKLDVEDNTGNPRFPSYGRTPLHTAAFFGNESAVRWCITEAKRTHPNNAVAVLEFINRQEKGRQQKNSAVHNAAYAGQWESMLYLLNNGAHHRGKNYSDNTPLMEVLCSERSTAEQKVVILRAMAEQGHSLVKDDFLALTEKTRNAFDDEILPILQEVKNHLPGLKIWIAEYLTNKSKPTMPNGFDNAKRVYKEGKQAFINNDFEVAKQHLLCAQAFFKIVTETHADTPKATRKLEKIENYLTTLRGPS